MSNENCNVESVLNVLKMRNERIYKILFDLYQKKLYLQKTKNIIHDKKYSIDPKTY